VRSYASERIEFPLGTTLLSGDVGSGKSTVLLAAEFALFGIQRGELGGSDLLRHGKNEGSVRLCFEVSGKDVIINRALKRDKKGISQETGWIQIDGKRYSKTASELRAMVIEILGYPMEYQTKNPIVFRYTVYTPQDEMKRILFADADERLGILRKIFQIDKYGRIRANAEIAIRELRAMRREYDSLSADIEQITKEAESRRDQLESLGKELSQNQLIAKNINRELLAKTSEMEKLVEQIRSIGRRAQLAATKENIVKERRSRNQRIAVECVDLEKKILTSEATAVSEPNVPELSEQELAARRRELEKQRSELIAKCSLLESELKRYRTILDKGQCEFCGQTVADKHGFTVKVHEREKEIRRVQSETERIIAELTILERKQREISEYDYKVRLYNSSVRELREKKERLQELADERMRNEREIAIAECELEQLHAELGQMTELEAHERAAKAELAKIQARKSDVDRTLARVESQIDAATRELGRVEKEIVEKRILHERAVKAGECTNWLERTFIPLMQIIEQVVMSTIQQEFNLVFQSWFGTLIGNDNLSVEVDDQFAPLIMQEGYQTEYQNLSGGEKTAVALAYRLALNKAINALIESIRTKDLIILDEPTDGFSSEQIDRIRDVLNELNLQQMILVSHEPKIETFVENVIRFQKEGHLSRVVRTR